MKIRLGAFESLVAEALEASGTGGKLLNLSLNLAYCQMPSLTSHCPLSIVHCPHFLTPSLPSFLSLNAPLLARTLSITPFILPTYILTYFPTYLLKLRL